MGHKEENVKDKTPTHIGFNNIQPLYQFHSKHFFILDQSCQTGSPQHNVWPQGSHPVPTPHTAPGAAVTHGVVQQGS